MRLLLPVIAAFLSWLPLSAAADDVRAGALELAAVDTRELEPAADHALAPARRQPAVDIKSRAVLVVRADNGEVLYRKNSDQPLPIASITKLMTAMVVLDAGQPLDQKLKITADDIDRLRNTTSRLAIGTELTRQELLVLALMASENRAASALLRNYPGGRAAGVNAMNRKAREIGMRQTRFVEGTGLSGDNRSSPVDLVRLVKAADTYPAIRDYSTHSELTVQVGRHQQQFRNTNPLVNNDEWSISVTKTGFLAEAGRCLVMQARIADLPVIFVLMDSAGKLTRIGDANRVRQWLEGILPTTRVAGVVPGDA